MNDFKAIAHNRILFMGINLSSTAPPLPHGFHLQSHNFIKVIFINFFCYTITNNMVNTQYKKTMEPLKDANDKPSLYEYQRSYA